MTSPTASFTAQPLARQPGRSLLVAATAAALLLGLGARLSPAQTASTGQATAQISLTAAAPTLAGTAPSGSAGCWVTGDLVGEANPADLAAALCSAK